MHHHDMACQVVFIGGVHLICINVFTHVDLSCLRPLEGLIVQAICGMEAELNNGQMLLLHLRLPPTILAHHASMVNLSGIHPHSIIRSIDLQQIPQEYQRCLVVRLRMKAHSKVQNELTWWSGPLLHMGCMSHLLLC